MRRWARKDPRSQEPDETFPFFTIEQAATFRTLVRDAFGAAGLEVAAYADHVVDSDGITYGLGNVAASCRNDERGEAAWPEITREHAARITEAMREPSPFETMSQSDLLAATYPRLMRTTEASTIPTSYARPVADGIVEVLNLDLPTTVATWNDQHVADHGPLEDLRRAGMVNLAGVPLEQHETISHQGASFEVVMGDSMFVATTALILDDVVRRHDPAGIGPDGAFVVMPFRHQMAWHVLRDSTAVLAVQLMTRFAQAGFSDAVGALSPDAYWWQDGRLERITFPEDDGTTRIEPGPELTETLTRLMD